MDLLAIARALAARYDPSNVTAPSGLQNIRLSTERLPDFIAMPPTVIVFPPEEQFAYTPGSRQSVQDWPIRFYEDEVSGPGRTVERLYRWRPVLVGQLLPNTQLGQAGSGGVAWAGIVSVRIGTLGYGEKQFQGIEMMARVRLAEGINPIA
jgi:hypothetical protein